MLEAVIRAVVTPASVAVFVVLALLGAALHGRLARSTGTRKIPTLAATTALAAGTAVTLTPQRGPEFGLSARRIFACPLGWPDSSGLLDLPTPTQSSLNSLVLLPFGICAGLAVRNRLQTAAVVAVILLLPALVEASQGFTLFVRHCSAQDWLDNASGGLLGLALVLLVRGITVVFTGARHRDGSSTEQRR
ncbi:VanZ like family protein [Actinopolyspora lacussalsi subsp. righensis]|uniref:VanZ like family protein n=1 Tax=Actinopolyspora righensis TaxID=995060 RepID=A0A1I6Y3M8_9ACTN|nr:VanZ family protein [Actinopolyspora righensis]SFT45140.1 VanZ like family protein [Actinopolyspora righensis]